MLAKQVELVHHFVELMVAVAVDADCIWHRVHHRDMVDIDLVSQIDLVDSVEMVAVELVDRMAVVRLEIVSLRSHLK